MVRRWTGSSSEPGAWAESGERGRGRQARGDCGAPLPEDANATSLKPCRIGASRFQPMRVTEAVRRWRRQYKSHGPEGPGHRRLDRRHVAHDDHVAVGPAAPPPASAAKSSSQAAATRPSTSARLSPPCGRKSRSPLPPLPHLGRDAAQRLAFELAVVDLDPPFVDLDRRSPRSRSCGGVDGPGGAGSSAPRRPDPAAGRGPPPPGPGPCSVSSASVRPSEQTLPRWPPTRRGAPGSARPAHAAQAGTRMRPHCSQVATSPGGRARIFSTSTEDSSRWHPSQRLPDEARRAGALEARPQRLVAVGQRGGKLGRLGGRVARRPRPAAASISACSCRHLGPQLLRPAPPAGCSARAGRPARRRSGSWSSMATSSSSSSSARRSVRWRTSSFMACRSRPDELGRGVHPLLDDGPPLGDAGDLLLEVLLGGRQCGPARRCVRPLGRAARPAPPRPRPAPTSRAARRAGAAAG